MLMPTARTPTYCYYARKVKIKKKQKSLRFSSIFFSIHLTGGYATVQNFKAIASVEAEILSYLSLFASKRQLLVPVFYNYIALLFKKISFVYFNQ